MSYITPNVTYPISAARYLYLLGYLWLSVLQNWHVDNCFGQAALTRIRKTSEKLSSRKPGHKGAYINFFLRLPAPF